MRPLLLGLIGVLATGSPVLGLQQPQNEPRPTFRSGVARVSVAATVRDRRGRPVTSLSAGEFDLYDAGQRREILEFSNTVAPIALALLADVSGSMEVADKRGAARETARQVLAWMTPREDHVGLYVFDRGLEEVQSLQPAPGDVLRRLDQIEPYGRTSLFDAIAETGRRLAAAAVPRRAVVVLTDGYDNASRMSPEEVSGIASSIDVPVYVIVIVSPLDRAGGRSSVIEPQLRELQEGPLGNLARWTGGEIMAPVSPEDLQAATRQVVTELRHQYLIGFEPGRQPGWHPLELRTRRTDLTVRARSGYLVPARTGDRN